MDYIMIRESQRSKHSSYLCLQPHPQDRPSQNALGPGAARRVIKEFPCVATQKINSISVERDRKIESNQSIASYAYILRV